MTRDFNEKVEPRRQRRTHPFLFPYFLTSAQHCPHLLSRPVHDHSNASFSHFLQLLSTFPLRPSLHNAPLLHLFLYSPSIDARTPPTPYHLGPFLPSCMTAPTQELPSWLSYSTSVATNDQGDPTATFTTVINLPLTYYGPSVSL